MNRRIAAILALFSLTLASAPMMSPREGEPAVDDRFVLVDLTTVANDRQSVSFPAQRITVDNIPFDVIAGEDANCLFLKPIGWAAATDESGEYRGYIADYDRRPAADDRTRAVVQIPVADYDCAWLLASTADDETLTTDLTLRVGRLGGPARTTYRDFTAVVPRSGDKKARRGKDGVVRVIPTEHGNVYLIRVPMNQVLAQDFKDHWALDLDITKKLGIAIRRPDPHRFQLRPLGDPSGVRIHALTLDRTSLQMEVTGTEPGNVFNQPQKPTFDILFRNHYEHYREYHLEAEIRRDDGATETFTFPPFRPWHPRHRNPMTRQQLELEVTARGHYELTVRLIKGKQLVLYRETTFAVLAPDTRRHRHESPFGVWDFGGGHTTPSDIELTGSLAVKAGWRYMRHSAKHALEAFNEPNLHRPKAQEKLLDDKQNKPDFVTPQRLLLYHETAISGAHVTRTPDVFTGKNYTLSEAERERFDELWDQAHEAYAFAAREFPAAAVYFGNGAPHLLEEFCRRGIAKDLLTIAGNECGSFMRPPETQPTDFVSNNAGLWMFRQILDHYGYTDTKVYQCYEITYPNTNPGNLSYRTQAAYYVRHIMHSLAWRIPKISVGSVTDMGNSYYHSNWGGSGFCFAYPNVSPKLSYVAYAVLTQALDGARFIRVVPTGSTTVYALEFKTPDRGCVTCLWTTRGTRLLTVKARARRGTLTAMLGRESTVDFVQGEATVEASPSPVYLNTRKPIRGLDLGPVTHRPPPAGRPFVLSELTELGDWTVEQERSRELEVFNFMTLRRKGEFSFRQIAHMGGRENVLGIEPTLPCPGSEYLQMYSVLRLNEAVEIPDKPTEIGLWVHGNGGWGRVIFELEDASGQRWISIGAEMGGEPNPWLADWMPPAEFEKLKSADGAGVSDWNSSDAWGKSFINHEGWRYVSFPLPGHYGRNSDGYHWPYSSQWRFSGDGKVTYPLRFTKLIVTLPEKVLYVDRYEPVARQEIYVHKLQVTYVPAEDAFLAE